MAQPQDEPTTKQDEQEAALLVLAQILANVIKRDVDAKLKADGSRRTVKSV